MDEVKALYVHLKQTVPSLEMRADEPLARHTSFRIGGPADLILSPRTWDEAAAVMRAAESFGIRPFLMGRGSNLLVSDAGYRGVVLKWQGETLRLEADEMLYAEAGISLAHLAVFAMEHSLDGLAFAHGIPGSLGGAVVMNAGAYDGEMSQVVTEIHCLGRDGEFSVLTADEADFSYRHSVFLEDERLVLAVRMQLHAGSRAEIMETMRSLMARRREKQPLEYASGGSTFKRPPGQFAGALIEASGLKGYRVGDAEVSEKHAGFVVNRGAATAADVLAVMEEVQTRVTRDHGVTLEPELRFLGF